jgi:outer membrane protein assembly factor BamB
MLDPNRPLFIGTNKYIAAICPATGRELWRTRLTSSGGYVVSLMYSDGRLFAGHGGNVFCLDPENGAILWNNPLPRMGFHPVMLAREGVLSDQDALIATELAAQAQADAGAAAASTA